MIPFNSAVKRWQPTKPDTGPLKTFKLMKIYSAMFSRVAVSLALAGLATKMTTI